MQLPSQQDDTLQSSRSLPQNPCLLSLLGGHRIQTVATVKRYVLRLIAAFPLPSLQPPTNQLGLPRIQPFNNMAWRSSGATNRDLVENLWTNGLITSPAAKEAFLKVRPTHPPHLPLPKYPWGPWTQTNTPQVDRANYSPRAPYEDSPQSIGHEATISAPHMHATAVESLLPYLTPTESNPAPRALDVGSGSGYLTHVLAELVGERGTVVGVEHIDALRRLGEENMGRSERGREFLRSGRVAFRVGDGRKGWRGEVRGAEEGVVERRGDGWDVIHVGASAAEVHPELVEQLRAPGRMFIPVDDEEGGWGQHVWTVDKDGDGVVTKKKLFGVRYVPLTDAPK